MFKRMKGIDTIVKNCMEVRPGQNILIVTDDYARSIKISQQVAEACDSEGAEVVMAIMAARTHQGQEPPRSIAEAMQVVDIIFQVSDSFSILHTNAGKSARDKGIKYVSAASRLGEDYFNREISVDDLNRIKERTERLAEIMSSADEARFTSGYGNEIRMSLKDRKGIAIHPLNRTGIITVPDYAEAAVAPVEGSTEGILVVDGWIRNWNFTFREPLQLTVKSGKVVEVSGPEDYVGRLKDLLAMDEQSSNCAAELGIGTSHTMLKEVVWGQRSGPGLAGTAHIAVGRNNDIGGKTLSQIHYDLIVTKPTVWLDDLCVLENGELKI
ncbi:aminopeptidase [Chloroflexota bacterium]